MDNLYRSLYRFEGLVPLPGYELIEVEGETLLSLQGGKPLGITYSSHKYDLFQKYPVLFREFAFLELTPLGVLEFAQKYGSIGGYEDKTSRDYKTYERDTFQEEHIVEVSNTFFFWLDHLEREGSKKYYCEAEHLERWYTEAQQLRLCLVLWELMSSKEHTALGQHLSLNDDALTIKMPFVSPNLQAFANAIWNKFDPDIQNVEIEETPYQMLRLWFDGGIAPVDEPLDVALRFFELIINAHLGLTAPTASINLSLKRFQITVQPYSFLGALWLQFAQALDGQKSYNVCTHCGNWFDIGKWGSRRDKKYCSASCKQAAYDSRQRAAK